MGPAFGATRTLMRRPLTLGSYRTRIAYIPAIQHAICHPYSSYSRATDASSYASSSAFLHASHSDTLQPASSLQVIRHRVMLLLTHTAKNGNKLLSRRNHSHLYATSRHKEKHFVNSFLLCVSLRALKMVTSSKLYFLPITRTRQHSLPPCHACPFYTSYYF